MCLGRLIIRNKKRGLSCCLFRGSGSRIAFQVEQTTRSPRRYVCAYILATSGYNPPIYETCMTSIYTPSGHPSLLSSETSNEGCEVSISSKQSVIRRLYKIHVRKSHPVALAPRYQANAARTSLRGLCGCKDTTFMRIMQINVCFFILLSLCIGNRKQKRSFIATKISK